jgi:putative flippase GtrA
LAEHCDPQLRIDTVSAPPHSVAEPGLSGRRQLVGKVVRYSVGSGVATVCSEAAFLLLYGALGSSTTVASVVGWVVGAVPNYALNRSWTWGRRGRPSLRGEVVPYATIVLTTLLLAIVATSLVDRGLAHDDTSDPARTTLVGATFLLVYLAVFVVRFFLFDRLFRSGRNRSASLGAMSNGAEG